MNDLNPIATVVDAMQTTDAIAIREKVVRLEEEMRKHPQIVIETMHHFAPGIYAREVFIPAGALVTGKIHKTDHINIVSKGDITVLTDDGMKRIKAPFTFVASAGTKRAGYAHEDTVWTTIHASNETDLDKLEAELISPTFEELPSVDVQKLKGE